MIGVLGPTCGYSSLDLKRLFRKFAKGTTEDNRTEYSLLYGTLKTHSLSWKEFHKVEYKLRKRLKAKQIQRPDSISPPKPTSSIAKVSKSLSHRQTDVTATKYKSKALSKVSPTDENTDQRADGSTNPSVSSARNESISPVTLCQSETLDDSLSSGTSESDSLFSTDTQTDEASQAVESVGTVDFTSDSVEDMPNYSVESTPAPALPFSTPFDALENSSLTADIDVDTTPNEGESAFADATETKEQSISTNQDNDDPDAESDAMMVLSIGTPAIRIVNFVLRITATNAPLTHLSMLDLGKLLFLARRTHAWHHHFTRRLSETSSSSVSFGERPIPAIRVKGFTEHKAKRPDYRSCHYGCMRNGVRQHVTSDG